jgi:ribosomal-protein-alanine N-acetyltransferase
MQIQTKPSTVRWMTVKDVPQVSSIAGEDLVDLKLSGKDLVNFAKSRNHVPKVVSSGSRILGFTLYVVRQRSIEILAICIRESRRRQGLGGQLMDELKDTAGSLGKDFLSCHVPESNLEAQLFFKSRGFRWVSTVETTSSSMPRWVTPGSLYKMQCVAEDLVREDN